MRDEPHHPSFEEVYPKFEFAPLVSAALYAAEWIRQRFASTRGCLEVVHKEPRSIQRRPQDPEAI